MRLQLDGQARETVTAAVLAGRMVVTRLYRDLGRAAIGGFSGVEVSGIVLDGLCAFDEPGTGYVAEVHVLCEDDHVRMVHRQSFVLGKAAK